MYVVTNILIACSERWVLVGLLEARVGRQHGLCRGDGARVLLA